MMEQAPIIPFTIERDMYEKISDDLICLGTNCVVRFNTMLATYKEDEREYYHKEYMYKSNKTNNNCITVRRNLQYYLSIENIRPDFNTNIKEFIMVGVNDYTKLKIALDKVQKWFISELYHEVYATHDGNLTMISQPEMIFVNNLPMGKNIAFKPILITYQDGTNIPGVRMFLSNENNYTDFNIDYLFGFYYQILSLNMHLYAQNMVNYLEHPSYGTNLTDMNNLQQYDSNRNSKYQSKPVMGRQVGGRIDNNE